MKRIGLAGLLSLLLSGSLAADQSVLLIGTERYRYLNNVAGGTNVVSAADTFEDAGARVLIAEDGEISVIRDRLDDFADVVSETDAVLIAMVGQFVTDGTRTWYLARTTGTPDHLLEAGQDAVLLETVLTYLGQLEGPSVLALGLRQSDEDYIDGLSQGLGPLDVPENVTVIRGGPNYIAGFLGEEIAQPGRDLVEAVTEADGASFIGEAPDRLVFVPNRPSRERDRPRITLRPGDDEDRSDVLRLVNERRDARAWETASESDTVEAYRAYLDQFPRGRRATDARIAIDRILSQPERQARLAEEALNLSRDERQQIQRDLTILDYNTRGIDGIFGPGTRGAITNWQQQNGLEQSSYLTTVQIRLLREQAQRRSDILEAEAQRERERVEQEDRAYWRETGRNGGEGDLRRYLERYPDGLFADQARDRLNRIEEDARATAAVEERRVWDRYREADSAAGYREYLERYPNGSFRGQARERLTALENAQSGQADRERAEAQERALGLNAITARLIEARLADLGLEPGAVDGRFTNDTRRALRRYQRSRNLPVTGYMNEPTAVRLLADSILR
ncbi:peptidoglycan-binding protein [Aestuariibius insulae]|uniref:peptidoglycan-binding domain-containing protein n=1 Tax=Aestuariibius insulae TaxID=2058287 RepID=UPI00345F0FDE